MYRLKELDDPEWSQLNAKILSLFKIVLNSKGRIAVFLGSQQVGCSRTILIPAYKSELLEALTPGGWKNCYDVKHRRWTLFAGTSTAFADFGVLECVKSYTQKSDMAGSLDCLNHSQISYSPREVYLVN